MSGYHVHGELLMLDYIRRREHARRRPECCRVERGIAKWFLASAVLKSLRSPK